MIRVNENETFPILVSLVDEASGVLASGRTIYYDIRDINDAPLSPPISGTLTESIVEPGIYRTTESIDTAGTYICYATCSGFLSNTEEIIVNPENIYSLVKQTQNYNISVEDVPRTTASGSMTASQLIRNVPLGKTDYIVTKIKGDSDVDWSNPVTSGTIWAWYHSTADELPYMMGDDGL